MKVQTPILVRIIAWWILMSGVVGSWSSIFSLFLNSGDGIMAILIGALNLIISLSLVIVSFGLYKMRKIALFAFTGLTLLTVLGVVLIPPLGGREFYFLIIQILILIYLWSLSKRMV